MAAKTTRGTPRRRPAGRRVAESLDYAGIDDLVQPHTLGRGFYMRPDTRPLGRDREYSSNEQFWHDVLSERTGAERTVVLRHFNIFDWVPRNPGLYHTDHAEYARREAQWHVRAIEPTAFRRYIGLDGAAPDAATAFRSATASTRTARTIIYTPPGKVSMLRGGIGCVRFKPLSLKSGRTAWLLGASSSLAPDEGIPLLADDNDYQQIVDDLYSAGAVTCDIIGRTRFVPQEFSDVFSVFHGIPRLYVEVTKLTPRERIRQPAQVSVAASFVSSYEGVSKIYASYVTFDPGRQGARQGAARWLKEEYVERLYEGTLLTDFDQRAPTFADSLFTLDQVLTSPDLAGKIAELARIYGRFDWRQLDSFSYIEHRGDLIVTNNTITVSNSTNVVIQSTLRDAQLTANIISGGSEDDKQRLRELLTQLQEALPRAPFDKQEHAEAVATQAKILVEEAAKSQPNKTTVRSFGQALKSTAEFLKDAVPSITTIAGQIVSLTGKILGIS